MALLSISAQPLAFRIIRFLKKESILTTFCPELHQIQRMLQNERSMRKIQIKELTTPPDQQLVLELIYINPLFWIKLYDITFLGSWVESKMFSCFHICTYFLPLRGFLALWDNIQLLPNLT